MLSTRPNKMGGEIIQESVEVGQHYKHYKGNVYRVLAIAKHTENYAVLVVYQHVDNPSKIWARPLKNFFDEVTFITGNTAPRFKKVSYK